MKIIDLKQGSKEWLEHRSSGHNASELGIVMGVSPYVSREDLVYSRASGEPIEVDSYVSDVVFPEGHRVEEATRPKVEELLGEELYPVCVQSDDGYLSASLDGLTMDETVIWECKQWSEEKYKHIKEHETIPECDFPQCLQQMVITGAKMLIYSLSDGGDNHVAVWLKDEGIDPKAEQDIRAFWRVFDEDVLKANLPAKRPKVETSEYVFDLPVLDVSVKGVVAQSNLDEFKERALEFIEGINTNLSTDEDFSDAKQAVKWCEKAESSLKKAKDDALSNTADIKLLFETMDEVREAVRQARLNLQKAQKAERARVVNEIITRYEDELESVTLDARKGIVGYEGLLSVNADFREAVKGKSSISNMEAACHLLLSNIKAQIIKDVDAIKVKIDIFEKGSQGYEYLFHDRLNIVSLDAGTIETVVGARIKEEQLRKKEEEEAIRIQAEEEARRKVAEEEARKEREREEEERRQEEERMRQQEEERMRQQEEERMRQQEEEVKEVEPSEEEEDNEEDIQPIVNQYYNQLRYLISALKEDSVVFGGLEEVDQIIYDGLTEIDKKIKEVLCIKK